MVKNTYPLGNCVIAFNEIGEVLIVNRPNSHTVSLPGGKLEAFEDAVNGARRELVEETGLFVRTADLVPVYVGVCSGETDYWVTAFLYVKTCVKAEVQLAGELDLIPRWAEVSELLTLGHFAEYNRRALLAVRDYLKMGEGVLLPDFGFADEYSVLGQSKENMNPVFPFFD